MTYQQFKKWVAERGYTVRQLRCDDAPPTAEMEEVMSRIGLDRYERYVLRYEREQGK